MGHLFHGLYVKPVETPYPIQNRWMARIALISDMPAWIIRLYVCYGGHVAFCACTLCNYNVLVNMLDC